MFSSFVVSLALCKAQKERQLFEGGACLFLPLHRACLAEAPGVGGARIFLFCFLVIVSMWSLVEDLVILVGF